MAQEWFEKPVFVRKSSLTRRSDINPISQFVGKVGSLGIAIRRPVARQRCADPIEDISNLIAGASLLLKIAFNVIFWKVMHSEHPSDARLDRQ